MDVPLVQWTYFNTTISVYFANTLIRSMQMSPTACKVLRRALSRAVPRGRRSTLSARRLHPAANVPPRVSFLQNRNLVVFSTDERANKATERDSMGDEAAYSAFYSHGLRTVGGKQLQVFGHINLFLNHFAMSGCHKKNCSNRSRSCDLTIRVVLKASGNRDRWLIVFERFPCAKHPA